MKQAYFFIDDFIWTLRDVAREKPASLFDNKYFNMLKRAHDNYGLTVQLNLFYRTDFFYGEDMFTLSEFPDCYKAEFEVNSHWLKMAFHATQEFPDYPYVNADYEDVKIGYERVVNEIKRFAGEKSVSNVVVPHWLPISREGCKALADCGVKFLSCSIGTDVTEYIEGDEGFSGSTIARILHNRKPETKIHIKNWGMGATSKSPCAHNHLSDEQAEQLTGKNISLHDDETGINFKLYSNGPCLNRFPLEEIIKELNGVKDCEFVGLGNHEQYYYPDYYRYQPDMEEKIMTMARMLHNYGFTFITCEDFK